MVLSCVWYSFVVATFFSTEKIIESEEEMLVIVKDLSEKVIQSLHSLAAEKGLSEQEVRCETSYSNGSMDINMHGLYAIVILIIACT